MPNVLRIIPRLVENMVPVTADTLALEQVWEAQPRCHLVFGNEVVAVFGLVDDEFTNL